MNDRELIGVFWATVAAIPVILLIVWGVNRGLDQQERREKLDEITRLGQEIEAELDSPDFRPAAMDDLAARGYLRTNRHSLTAVETADQPSASDSPRRGGGTSFQQEQ